MHKMYCQEPGKISCHIYAPVHGSKWKETLGYTGAVQVALMSSCSAVQPRDACVVLPDISWGCLWEQVSLTEFDIQQQHKIVIIVSYTSVPQ